MIEEAAKAAATPFAEVELYKGIAARATCDSADAKSRLRNATPTLLAMIGADDGSIAVLGAVLSVALGAVPSRAAALERLEAATMAREELHQRTVDALNIPTPTMSEKKKAGKKGDWQCLISRRRRGRAGSVDGVALSRRCSRWLTFDFRAGKDKKGKGGKKGGKGKKGGAKKEKGAKKGKGGGKGDKKKGGAKAKAKGGDGKKKAKKGKGKKKK